MKSVYKLILLQTLTHKKQGLNLCGWDKVLLCFLNGLNKPICVILVRDQNQIFQLIVKQASQYWGISGVLQLIFKENLQVLWGWVSSRNAEILHSLCKEAKRNEKKTYKLNTFIYHCASPALHWCSFIDFKEGKPLFRQADIISMQPNFSFKTLFTSALLLRHQHIA